VTYTITSNQAVKVAVLVLRHVTEEFGAVSAQAGKDVLDVFDGEHDAMQAQRVGRRVLRLGAGRRPDVATGVPGT
jgi:hypothetical protein